MKKQLDDILTLLYVAKIGKGYLSATQLDIIISKLKALKGDEDE